MQHIKEVVRRAALRMGWNHANRLSGRAIAGTLGVACLVILTDKLIFLGAPAYYTLAGIAGCAAIVTLWLARRAWPNRMQAAIEIDDRLRLGERVSTAMAVAKEPGPMAQAVIADTRAYAKAVPVKTTFPMKMHWEYWIAFALAFAALGLLCLPQYDLLARKERRELALKEKKGVQEEAEKMRKELADIRKKLTAVKDRRVMEHLDELEQTIKKMEKGEISRGDALAKIDTLEKQQQALYDKKKNFDFSPASRKKDYSVAKDLAKALENKDFEQAAAELKSLAQKASEGKLSKDEQAKLNEELQRLAEQLGGAKELSEALQKCASCMNEADAEALKKSLADAKLQLDKLADIEKELAVLSQCKGLCQCAGKGLAKKVSITDMAGIYTPGEGQNPGSGMGGQGVGAGAGQGGGMGGPGTGQGGSAPVQPTSVSFQTDKVKGKMQEGQILGSFMSPDGKNVKGESKVDFREAAEAAEKEAATALQSEQVPHAYENYIREYFQDMKGQ